MNRTSLRSSFRFPRSWRPLAAALFAALPVTAQWAAIPTAPTDPVYQEGFQVLTVTGGQACVFSAMTRSWRILGPLFDGGYATPPLQSGDFVALLRMSDHDYRAYSARLDQYADIHFEELPDQVTVRVEDDVILMIGTEQAGQPKHACGYSGQTNQWRSVGVAPCSAATSRFVLGVKIDGVNESYGFSARYGAWVQQLQYGGELFADGNVLLLKGAAPDPSVAFSGVLGTWAVSPAQNAASVPALDHNVAYLRASTMAPAGSSCAYSAYTGRWLTGGPAATERLGDNTVLIDVPAAGANKTYRAFGARPGAWASVTVPSAGGVVATSDADWIVVNSTSTTTLYGFSGLCSNAWQAEPYGGTILVASGPDNVALGRDTGGDVHAFSAMDAAWAPVLAFPGSVATFTGMCQAVVENTATRTAYSIRRNAWVAGPAKDPAATHAVAWGGSAYCERNQTTGELVFWHERASRWITTSLIGAGTPGRYAGRNVILLDATGLVPAGSMLGFSAQRGDLVAAPGFTGVPLAPPVAEENVAWVRDSASVLFAFGSPTDHHTFFQWPLDTEYQVFTGGAMPAVPMKTMVRGNAGDLAFLLLALAPSFPGLPVPSLGTLYLDPATLLLPPLGPGVVGTNGLIPAPIVLGIPGIPGSAGLWQQALLFTGATPRLVGPTPEPARFF